MTIPSEGAAPTAPPAVLLVGGYAGSGKSTLGAILARRARWALLDKDSASSAVVEAALQALGHSPHDRESALYRDVLRPAEYQALITSVMENVDAGNSVIATAPFVAELADPRWCRHLREQLDARGARLHTAWIRCDADTMYRNITRRGAHRDAGKLADWDGYLERIDLGYSPALADCRVIDNNAGVASLEDQAVQLLADLA
ncbi:ATP-binding protein (plasmid) [Amycolatopsis sp. FU40]|uniref:AAA family ATPase n=1 Tax=Amycolatopsis sp. FU40 TaxID=2914159 RepID=UPI001F2B4085|nr:AAA family ATPase [Amycolatopsis sp. FU40]UKD50844.1 ATP-binding protein [Amycolatopsis sp. FU40]